MIISCAAKTQSSNRSSLSKIWMTLSTTIQRSAKKFKGWPRYSHGMRLNEFYFLINHSMRSTHFNRCCSVWIPLVKNVIYSRYDITIWTFQPTFVYIVKRSTDENKVRCSKEPDVKKILLYIYIYVYIYTLVAYKSSRSVKQNDFTREM